jgi:Domain of unknown function (DUF4266)
MAIARTLALLLVATSLAACTPVKAWERGNLGRPEMSLSTDASAQKIQDHIYHSKEGSASVTAGSGGGCGCN